MINEKEFIRIGLMKINREVTYSWDDIGNMFNMYGEEARQKIKQYRTDNGLMPSSTIDKTRILVISDNHYPYNLPKEIYKDYIGKVDILLFNGDEQDCQSVSKFPKTYRVPFVDEMIGTRQMITDIIQYIKPKKVMFNYGNHNVRLLRYFSEKVHEDLLSLMPETNLDFIVDMGFWKNDHENGAKTFYEPLKKVFDNKIDLEYTKNWWCRIGNTIFAHPKAFSSGILATTEKAYIHFIQLGQTGLDCMVLAHTHQLGISRYGQIFLAENGCSCIEPSYAKTGNMSKPQVQGFAYIVQDNNGKFLYDLSKIICVNA